MRQRLLSAAVLVPVVIAAFLLGDPWLTLGLAILAALAALETARLLRAAGLPADAAFGVLLAPAAVVVAPLLIAAGGIELGWMLVAPSLAVVVIVAAGAALRHQDAATGLRAWVATLLAIAYPALLAFAALIVAFGRQDTDAPVFGGFVDSGRGWLLVLVLTVWALDSAAYVVGRSYGRGRFFNHISPRKTWSGAAGGTIAAMVVCMLLVSLGLGLAPAVGLLVGLVIAVSAQAGDLAESMLKRAAGAKDSGSLIPGHGGVLDRLDSFLFAAPALFVAVNLATVLGQAAVP